MDKVGAVIISTLALLCGTVSAVTPDAAKCKPCNVTTVPLTLDGLASLKPWRLLYVTGAAPFSQVDNQLRDGYRITDNMYRVIDRRRMADNSEDREEFMASLVDNIGYEDTSDVKGNLQRFYNYFVAVTSEYGVLMYRCSDNGRAGMDTRYIWIPASRKLSDSGLQQLMDADSRCNFKGQLHKLPEKLRKPKE